MSRSKLPTRRPYLSPEIGGCEEAAGFEVQAGAGRRTEEGVSEPQLLYLMSQGAERPLEARVRSFLQRESRLNGASPRTLECFLQA